jgi:hypothetical protein
MGQVMVRYTDEDGKEQTINERLDLPADIANGLLMTLVKHVQPNISETTVSFVAITPKPRLVKLVIVARNPSPMERLN